jgi:hypothetical protein
MLPQQNEDCLLQTIGGQLTNIGTAEAVVGEGMHGEYSGARLLNVTGINAADVNLQKISRSTIKKMREKQAASGITHLKTSKHSVGVVTSRATGKQSTTLPALFVENPMLPEVDLPVVQKNVNGKLCGELGKSLTLKNNDLTSASSAGICSKDIIDDGNIVETNVSKKSVQHGNENIESTFWESSKIIVQGCYALLKPGGISIWVCKDYVKKGQRVPFSDRWQSLCESVGFTLVCRHQAMLVENHGVKTDLLGVDEEINTERKSFFRRLAEKKGSPRIDFEDVLCFVKEK